MASEILTYVPRIARSVARFELATSSTQRRNHASRPNGRLSVHENLQYKNTKVCEIKTHCMHVTHHSNLSPPANPCLTAPDQKASQQAQSALGLNTYWPGSSSY